MGGDASPATGRVRGVGLGVVDQGLSSASNVIMVLAVARTSGVAEFGQLALLLLLVSTALTAVRGSFGTPVLLTGGRSESGYDREAAGALTAAVLVGLMAAVLVLACGAAMGVLLEAAVIALALPLVLAQDMGRYSALARGDQRGAVLWDGVWTVGSVALLVTTWVAPALLSAPSVLAVWAALALVSGVGLLLRGRVFPLLHGLRAWWNNHVGRLRYGIEAIIGAVTALVVVAGAAAVAGPDASAALRGAGTLLGPLSVVMAAVPLAVVPDTSRSARSAESTWGALRRIGWLLFALALTVGLIAPVLPDWLGAAMLGDTWAVASPLLPITALEYAGLAWVSVTYTLMRALGRSSALLRARCLHSALSLTLALTAAVLWQSAIAVAWGLAVTAYLTALAVRPIAGLRLGHRPAASSGPKPS